MMNELSEEYEREIEKLNTRIATAGKRIAELEAALKAVRQKLAQSRTSGIQGKRDRLVYEAEELVRAVL